MHSAPAPCGQGMSVSADGCTLEPDAHTPEGRACLSETGTGSVVAAAAAAACRGEMWVTSVVDIRASRAELRA